MARTTKQDLVFTVAQINNSLRRLGRETQLVLGFAYGQPRIAYRLDKTPKDCIAGNLSPRLSKTRLAEWLGAYQQGLWAQ